MHRRAGVDVEGARRAVDEAMDFSAREGSTEAKALGHYIMGSQIEEGEHDHKAAIAEFRAGLRLAHLLQSRRETAFGVSAIGLLLANAGEHERASVLLGAAEKLWENVAMPPNRRRAEAYARAVEGIEQQIGEAERIRLWAGGRDMPLEKVVSLAVEEHEN